MEIKRNEYVRLDGMFLKREQLIKLAANAGCYALAEHYLLALAVSGLMNDQPDVLGQINEVRRLYGVAEFTQGDNEEGPAVNKWNNPLDIKAKEVFRQMSETEQQDIIRGSLGLMNERHHIFKRSGHWLSVYLVLRDRLYGVNFKMKDLLELSDEITPFGWSSEIQMTENTYKNLSRVLKKSDKGLAYYKMSDNPQALLCEKLWDIIKEQILAGI